MNKKTLFEEAVTAAENELKDKILKDEVKNPNDLDVEYYTTLLVNKLMYEFPGIHFWPGFTPSPEFLPEKIENAIVQIHGTIPWKLIASLKNASKEAIIVDQKIICAWILPPKQSLDEKIPLMNADDYFMMWRNNSINHPILNQYIEYCADYGFELILQNNMDSIISKLSKLTRRGERYI